VVSFDQMTDRVVNRINLKFDKKDLAERFNFTVKNRKAYLLTSPEKIGQNPQPATLSVIDFSTGNRLYKGVITVKNANNQLSKTDGFISLERLMVE